LVALLRSLQRESHSKKDRDNDGAATACQEIPSAGRFGYVAILVTLVTDEPRPIVRIPSPRVVRNSAPTYKVELTVRMLSPQKVVLIAHDEEPFILLGRDVLNRHRVLLDRPGLTLEID
jgi:hypothetical protein